MSHNDPDNPVDVDVEFRLALKTGLFSYEGLTNVQLKITDPCAQVASGPQVPPDQDLVDDLPLQPSWRADGKASVAGDLASGEALIAWLRYDTPDVMIQDGFTQANIPCPQGQICICGRDPTGDGLKSCGARCR